MVVVGLGKIRETAWEQYYRDGHALMPRIAQAESSSSAVWSGGTLNHNVTKTTKLSMGKWLN